MAALPDLNDVNQNIFSIPFTGSDDEEDAVIFPVVTYDVENGDELRLAAYKQAWSKCLTKLKSVIHALHAPVASKIVQEIYKSHGSPLAGLPYPEVPVISVTNPTSGSTFLSEIVPQIDSSDLDSQTPSFTTQLHLSDCSNLSSLMKALISGFIDRENILERVKGRSAVSLANYDIEMLVAWYKAIRNAYDIQETAQPKLVVLLHDFEQLDPLLIQDLFHLASLYVSKLPLVFLLSLSSPSSPSYLQITYPRSTLSLLRVQNFSVPSGSEVLQKIILFTFFDVHYEPDLVLGPGVLGFINDYIHRQNASLESLVTILQLTYLKHFSLEPLSALIHKTPDLSGEEAESFVEAVHGHLSASPEFDHDVESLSIADLRRSIDDARSSFRLKANRIRLGIRLIALIQESVGKRGQIPLNLDPEKGGINTFELICDILRDQAMPDIKLLGNSIKKLRPEHLADFLKSLKATISSLPDSLRATEKCTLQHIIDVSTQLNQNRDDAGPLGSDFAAWLIDYLRDILAPLEKSPLWNVWYTGETEFPSELLNPSLRASLIAGLTNPHDFCETSLKEYGVQSDDSDEALWTYPDTSILFRRYLDSGKMINIYDWFESFKLVLENQREHLKSQAKINEPKGKDALSTGKGKARNTRTYGKGGGRGAARMDVNEEAEEEEVGAQLNADEDKPDEEDEDAWKLQVQTRFMRAFHELDYLGFIKHTGRKPDHVLRMVFDILD